MLCIKILSSHELGALCSLRHCHLVQRNTWKITFWINFFVVRKVSYIWYLYNARCKIEFEDEFLEEKKCYPCYQTHLTLQFPSPIIPLYWYCIIIDFPSVLFMIRVEDLKFVEFGLYMIIHLFTHRFWFKMPNLWLLPLFMTFEKVTGLYEANPSTFYLVF